ncbi:MAG: hypothetical protein RIG62_15920 [Cyclobacteriaceae bacterium]
MPKVADETWNDITIRWHLASIAEKCASPTARRVQKLVLDLRLIQEPVPSLLKLISQEMARGDTEETAILFRQIQSFVFHPNFPSQYSSYFVQFLKESAHLFQRKM